MRSAIATRKGINISAHYDVSINAICFFIYVLCTEYSKKLKGRTESYFLLFLKLTIRHGVLISGYYAELIPTAVSSFLFCF